MKVHCISRENAVCRHLVQQQHELRARVFSDRLGWDVDVVDGIERDRFDDLSPAYIVAVGEGRVVGCARLLPASGPTMVRDVFHMLLPESGLSSHGAMVESSRFCVDTTVDRPGAQGTIHTITRTMFAGILEWSLGHGYSEIVTVTDLRFERLLAKAGWPLARLAPPRRIGETMAVAGTLAVNQNVFLRLCPDGYTSTIGTARHAA